MDTAVIHLNQRGINSIEAPKQVEVEAGKTVDLQLVNHGHPVHLTLSAINPQMFTHFVHENLFVDGELEFHIPIRGNTYAGFFDLEIITGYGTKRTKMRVIVKKPENGGGKEAVPPAPEPVAAPFAFKLPPQLHSVPFLMLAAALILYGLCWALPDASYLKDLAFFALLAGFVVAWFRKP
jgi:hypothetical protein